MKQLPRPAALLALALLTQCHKDTPAPTPEEQLPPATQTGAHTFGCLLNGQPWTPAGNYGPANYRLTYDPGYNGGDLEIKVYRVDNSINQFFSIGAAPITRPGNYPIDGSVVGVYYSTGVAGPCNEYYKAQHPGLILRGQLTITRLDQVAGIVSGTFAFKLWQPDCDTVKVTAGRFDYKL